MWRVVIFDVVKLKETGGCVCEFLIPVRRSVTLVRISIDSNFKLRVDGDSRESLKLGGGRGESMCSAQDIFISDTNTFLV